VDTAESITDDQTIEYWQTVTDGFARTQASISAALEELGIPDLWCAALVRLLRTEGQRLPMSKLAQQLSVTSGGFTKMADRMARDGLIDRRNASADRRVVHAALTLKGEAIAKRAARVYADGIRAHVLAVVGPDGLESLVSLMTTLSGSGETVTVPEEPGFVAMPHDTVTTGERRANR
jgi:DNA-binding MarR family transcriptional regulator